MVAPDLNSHSMTGEGHSRESNLTSLGVAIATSMFIGDEELQTTTISGVFRRPWQITHPLEPYTEVYNVSSPTPIEMHHFPPFFIGSSANIHLSSSSASSCISTSRNTVFSNHLKRRRLQYTSGSEGKFTGPISFKTYQ